MSKRTEHFHLRVTPALARAMRKAAKAEGRRSRTVNGLVNEILTAALGPTES